MRLLARVAASGAVVAALIATVAACSATPTLRTDEAVGQPLSSLNRSAADHAGLLIQDSSTRVGERASFALSTSDPKEWIIVAICADDSEINSAESVEIAIIPKAAYTASVENEVKAGDFRDAVTCEDLTYR